MKFDFLWRFLKRSGMAAVEVVDPWFWSVGYYVGEYRKQLEEIAKTMSSAEQAVRIRFDREEHFVEFERGGKAIARVVMHGECGLPYATIVTALSLSYQEVNLFTNHGLPGLRFDMELVAA